MRQNQSEITWVHYVVSVIPLALIIAKLCNKDLPVDNTTVFLLLIAMAPWLAPYIKTIKLPGGSEIEMKQLEDDAFNDGLMDNKSVPDIVKKAKAILPITDEAMKTVAGYGLKFAETVSQLAEANDVQVGKDLGKTIEELCRKLPDITPGRQAVLQQTAVAFDRVLSSKRGNQNIAELLEEITPKLLEKLNVQNKP